jgi:hypothetical protein
MRQCGTSKGLKHAVWLKPSALLVIKFFYLTLFNLKTKITASNVGSTVGRLALKDNPKAMNMSQQFSE